MPKTMQMDELYQQFKNGMKPSQLILDVRDADVFAEGHVPGARNLPLDELKAHIDELRSYSEIYVHCGGGGKAGRASKLLKDAGLHQVVHICESGFRSWAAAKYPIEK